MSKISRTLSVNRTTGPHYLGLAVSGVIFYLGIRSQIFIKGNPAQTLHNVLGKQTLSGLLVIFFLSHLEPSIS